MENEIKKLSDDMKRILEELAELRRTCNSIFTILMEEGSDEEELGDEDSESTGKKHSKYQKTSFDNNKYTNYKPYNKENNFNVLGIQKKTSWGTKKFN